jgi:hypothetical protein
MFIAVVHDVLRHRIGITYEAEAENIAVDIINRRKKSGVPKILDFLRLQVLDF